MPLVQKLIKTQCFMSNNHVVRAVGFILFLVLIWTFIFLLLKEEILPSGGLFKMLTLVLAAAVVGSIVSLAYLPALLGMMITGIVLKSVHFFDPEGIYLTIVRVSRDVALTVILIKAGLGLDPRALKKHLCTVIMLALFPCVAEAIAAAIASYYILNLPWLWAFLLGFLLSPISPAVVVPTLLSLKERGYGEDKGIATLVIAASSIDDIFSISVFGIFSTLIFSVSGELGMRIAKAPLEILIGICVGVAWGFVCACLPNKDDVFVVVKRSLMVGLGGLVMVLGGIELGYEGAGPLSCIASAFTASVSWIKQDEYSKRNTRNFKDQPEIDVSKVFSCIWLIMQPILFSFIGAEIDVTKINWGSVAYSLAVLVICLIIRVMSCTLVLVRSNLTWKECLFVNLAWLPKATVQAALSAQPLELVMSQQRGEEDLMRADMLLTTAVLAILITAPIGSLGITLTGTKLLKKKPPNQFLDGPNDETPL